MDRYRVVCVTSGSCEKGICEIVADSEGHLEPTLFKSSTYN